MRSVLITGSSSGFGLQTAVQLARDGWRVFASMRDPQRRGPLDEAASQAGAKVEVIQLDVADQESIGRAVSDVLASTDGALDAVVHNAGIADAGFFEDVTDEQFRRVMETNFFGVLALTRAVLPAMRDRRTGRIVVVTSVGAFAGNPAMSAYVSSKWALEGWAEALAIEVAQFGIDVALIEPGTYKTGIWTAATITHRPDSPYRQSVAVMEPRVRAMVERTGRDPVEVANRIGKVLRAGRPPLRHPVGPDARAMRVLSHLLPFSLRRRLVGRALGIPVRPTRP